MIRTLVLNARLHLRGNVLNETIKSSCFMLFHLQPAGHESCLQEVTSIVKAALTSGSLSALGDVLAQLLVKNQLKKEHNIEKHFELERTARMFTFGLFLYGPFQHYWYRALANRFPGTGLHSFGIKVTLNQVVLGPLVLCTAFSWNLALQKQTDQIVGKIKKDMFPTLVNGWKFWVPAACTNFFFVPVVYQVLWMSLCGVLWTGYISFASYNSANAVTIQK